ncbi:MAG: LysR family transcriptional regulator [Stomatobaculum sp.]|nr:LysR family transcriptional regulator [Stomatobaculum sp.]
MNFLNLRYFTVVAEEGSITAASRKLFLSQQSLSRHIAKLEKEYGVVLLNRTQPLTLTEAGQVLYHDAKALLHQKSQTETALQDIRDFRQGSLTIGITLTRGAVILPEILPEFHANFPQIRVNLKEGTTRQINKALYDGESDFNIGFSLNDPEHILEEFLYTEHLIVVFPRILLPLLSLQGDQALLPGSLQKLDLFAGCPFLRMTSGNWLRSIFDTCCADNGIEPEIVLETSSMVSLVSLCVSGLGAILLPETFVEHGTLFHGHASEQEDVILFRLDYPAGDRDVTINLLKGRYLPQGARELIRIARRCLKV